MPRIETKNAIDEYFHVYNRGVEKREVFLDKQDYLRFYESMHLFNTIDPVTNFSFARLQDYRNVNKLVSIEAYCLLPNHFHLLLKQKTPNGIGEFMKRLSGGYTSFFNNKYDRNGVLFQGIYKRVHIDSDEQLNHLRVYINENHHVHGIQRPQDIFYSSSAHFAGAAKSKLISSEGFNYDVKEAIKQAEQIYKQRQDLKKALIEI